MAFCFPERGPIERFKRLSDEIGGQLVREAAHVRDSRAEPLQLFERELSRQVRGQGSEVKDWRLKIVRKLLGVLK